MPIDHPLTALRLAFYLGGLACFGVPPVCEHLHLPRDSLVTSASLIAGLIFLFWPAARQRRTCFGGCCPTAVGWP